jgi:uncharacterized membrane protein
VDRYELLKFVHVGAAIVWVGGAAITQFFALRTIWSGDPLRLVAFTRDAEWVGNRVMLPSALVVIALGFLLVWDGPYELGMTWIWLALVLFALSFLLGLFVLAPEAKRIGNQIEAEGPESPAVQQRIKRILNIGRIDVILLFAIVFLMVVKPG